MSDGTPAKGGLREVIVPAGTDSSGDAGISQKREMQIRGRGQVFRYRSKGTSRRLGGLHKGGHAQKTCRGKNQCGVAVDGTATSSRTPRVNEKARRKIRSVLGGEDSKRDPPKMMTKGGGRNQGWGRGKARNDQGWQSMNEKIKKGNKPFWKNTGPFREHEQYTSQGRERKLAKIVMKGGGTIQKLVAKRQNQSRLRR